MAGEPDIFQALSQFWLRLIERSKEVKKKAFQEDADQAFRFFNGPYNFMYRRVYDGTSDDFRTPEFWMTSNRVAEMVQIFGPVLYHQNPQCQVEARSKLILPQGVYGDPSTFAMAQQFSESQHAQDQAKAKILEEYLNWIPGETDLATQVKRAVDEAIIKGRGILWVELHQPPGTPFRTVGAFWDTVDCLYIDPDCETLESAGWICRECVHPTWKVEREYGLPVGSLRSNISNGDSRYYDDGSAADSPFKHKSGVSADLIRYYKIYSRMGLGSRLQGGPSQWRQATDLFGDNVFLVVADNCPYPLNIPPQIYRKTVTPGIETARMAAEIIKRVSWPTPFWADNKWPCAVLDFHPVPRSPWPMSHLKPGMGELKFLNWAYSFIAGKVRNTCRDFIAVAKSAGDELKTAILEGSDLTLIEVESNYKTVTDVVQFLQHPQMNGDVFKVIQAVENAFDKRVGLNELMYGMSNVQLRSAAEADLKQSNMNVRPDDMAERVESFMTNVFSMLAGSSRFHLTGQDISPRLGYFAGNYWDQFLHNRNYAEAARELSYRIEAGSTRKPNRARDQSNIKDAMGVFFPPFMQYAMASGNFGPVNALVQEFCRVHDIKDPSRFILSPPPQLAGPPGAPGPGGPPPGVGGPPGPQGPPPGLPGLPPPGGPG